jgi:hypothetical protein
MILNKTDIKLKLLKFFWRIAFETKTIDQKKYISVEESLDEIGKILGGWIKKAKSTL